MDGEANAPTETVIRVLAYSVIRRKSNMDRIVEVVSKRTLLVAACTWLLMTSLILYLAMSMFEATAFMKLLEIVQNLTSSYENGTILQNTNFTELIAEKEKIDSLKGIASLDMLFSLLIVGHLIASFYIKQRMWRVLMDVMVVFGLGISGYMTFVSVMFYTKTEMMNLGKFLFTGRAFGCITFVLLMSFCCCYLLTALDDRGARRAHVIAARTQLQIRSRGTGRNRPVNYF